MSLPFHDSEQSLVSFYIQAYNYRSQIYSYRCIISSPYLSSNGKPNQWIIIVYLYQWHSAVILFVFVHCRVGLQGKIYNNASSWYPCEYITHDLLYRVTFSLDSIIEFCKKFLHPTSSLCCSFVFNSVYHNLSYIEICVFNSSIIFFSFLSIVEQGYRVKSIQFIHLRVVSHLYHFSRTYRPYATALLQVSAKFPFLAHFILDADTYITFGGCFAKNFLRAFHSRNCIFKNIIISAPTSTSDIAFSI